MNVWMNCQAVPPFPLFRPFFFDQANSVVSGAVHLVAGQIGLVPDSMALRTPTQALEQAPAVGAAAGRAEKAGEGAAWAPLLAAGGPLMPELGQAIWNCAQVGRSANAVKN